MTSLTSPTSTPTRRYTHIRSLLAPVVAGLAVTAGLAACGTTEKPVEPASRADAARSAATPVTVKDSRGKKVTLKDGPAKRVIALEWSETEDLVTLGVMPVGVAEVKSFGNWNKAVKLDPTVKDVGNRGEPSVDSIVALEPDAVFVEPERGQALISQLEKRVPVIVVQGSDAKRNIAQMKGNFRLIAKAVGKQDKAEKEIAAFDQALAAGTKKLSAAGVDGEGFAMADGWMEGSSVAIRMFGQGSLMSDIAEELGLTNHWNGKADPMWGLGQTDVEGLTALKGKDVHFFYSASEDDVFAEGLADNAIWKSLPFVKDGQLYKLDDGTWTFGGPRSCISFIRQVEQALAS